MAWEKANAQCLSRCDSGGGAEREKEIFASACVRELQFLKKISSIALTGQGKVRLYPNTEQVFTEWQVEIINKQWHSDGRFAWSEKEQILSKHKLLKKAPFLCFRKDALLRD